MKLVKKIYLFSIKISLGFIFFIISYLILIFILSIIPVNTIDSDQSKEVTIYIKTNGVHTDLVLPIKNESKDWTTSILFKNTFEKDSVFKFVSFGWGDKDFYLNTPKWSDLKAKTALKAVFYLGNSVLHAQFYKNISESKNCKKIEISKQEYLLLVQSISDRFYRDKVQNIVYIPNYHYNNNDAFYEAKGKYNLFYTCNSWANETLKTANQKAAFWTLTDFGIFYHYK